MTNKGSVMSLTNRKREDGAVLPYFIIIVAAFLTMAAVLWLTRDEARAPSVGSERAALRKENLTENTLAAEQLMNSYGVVNAEKGIYQIPIDRAVETMIREWKSPEKALATMAERVDLATALPAPPPEAPSEFE